GHRLVETAPHRGRTRDGERARSLADPGLHPVDGLGAVAGGGDPGILELRFDLFLDRTVRGPITDRRRHGSTTSPRGKKRPRSPGRHVVGMYAAYCERYVKSMAMRIPTEFRNHARSRAIP